MQTCDGLIQEISDCLNAETKSRKVPRFFYATENVVIPETTCTQVGSRGRIFIFHVESKGTEFNTGVRKSINKGLSEKWNTSIVLFEFTGSNDIDIVCNVPGSGRVAIESRIASIPQDDLQISMATQRLRDLSSKGFSSGELLHEFCMALPRKLQPLNLGVDPKKLDPLFKLQIRKDLHKPLARRKKVLSLLGDLKLENKDPSLFEELLGHQAKTIWSIASKQEPVGCETSDFYQLGVVTVLDKYERYDPDRSHFSSWMANWIRQAFQRYTAENCSIFSTHVSLFESLSVNRHGEADVKDSYKKSSFSMEDRRDAAQLISNSRSLEEIEPEEIPQLLESYGDFELKDFIQATCADLSYIQKTIVQHRFGLNGAEILTLEELGAIFKLTRERIRQLEKKALASLAKNQILKSHHEDLE